MNKKVLALLIAGLTLLSVSLVGCSDDTDSETGTGTGTETSTETGTGTGTETSTETGTGSVTESATATGAQYESANKDDPGTSPSEIVTSAPKEDETLEPNPVFTEVSKTLYVHTANINIRSAAVLSDSNVCGNVEEGATLTAIGESQSWYKIVYEDKVCYITKSVACDKALIDNFTDVNETATVNTTSVFVRTAPRIDTEYSKESSKTTLSKGTIITLTGVSDKWARFNYNGKVRYISLDCLSRSGAAETATSAETATETLPETQAN